MKQICTKLVILIALFALLVGCRSGDTQQPDAAATTTISLAASPNFQAAYEQIIEQFQEDQPQIQVQFVPLSAQQAGLSLREQAALADVVLLEGQPPTTDAAASFLDLTPLMAADPTFDGSDFWPGIMEACQAAGVQVGLPFRANVSLIFFDKAAFDAAGLPHPEPGWNWEDFQQAAQALTVSDSEQTIRYGFFDSGNPLGLLAPLVDNIIRASTGTLDGQRLAAELEWYVTLADENVILSESSVPVNSLLNQRQVGMWVGSQFGLPAARSALGDDLGVVSFPTTMRMTQNNPVSTGCALISAGTNQSQAAWTFLDYLSRQPLFTAGPLPAAPSRPSVAQSSNYWGQLEPETAIAVHAALEQGWYRRANMPELVNVGNALTQALSGETSLAESLPETVAIQPTAPPPTPDSDPVAVATPGITSLPDSDVIVVEYSPLGHDNQEAIILLAEVFNQSQDRIRVNAARYPPPSVITLNLIDFAQEYDCFMDGYRAASLAQQHGDAFFDAFYSLSPLFEAEDATFQNDFPLMAQYMESSTVNGQLYALPVTVRPIVIRYNANLLAEQGITPPTADWTVEDFWALVQAASSDSTYGLIAADTIFPDELLTFVPGADFYFDINTSPMRPKFTDPAVIGALEFLGQVAEAGVLYPHTQWASRHTLEEDREIAGQAHSVINLGGAAVWPHQVGSRTGSGRPVTYGVAPYPQRTLPNYINQEGFGNPSMLYISRRSPDPTACWEWFKFLTAQPDAFPGIPVRQSVRESQAWRDAVGEETAVAYETMYFRPRQELPDGAGWEFWPYRRWWADALLSVYQGEDPSLALIEAQRRAEAFYDCYAPLAELAYPDLPSFAQVLECAQQADPDFQW